MGSMPSRAVGYKRFPASEKAIAANEDMTRWSVVDVTESWRLCKTPEVGGKLKVYHDGTMQGKIDWYDTKIREGKSSAFQLMGHLLDVFDDKVKACHVWSFTSNGKSPHKAFAVTTRNDGTCLLTPIFEAASPKDALAGLSLYVAQNVRGVQ